MKINPGILAVRILALHIEKASWRELTETKQDITLQKEQKSSMSSIERMWLSSWKTEGVSETGSCSKLKQKLLPSMCLVPLFLNLQHHTKVS